MAIETPERPISPRNPQFPSPSEAQASYPNPNAEDDSATGQQFTQSQPFHLNSSRIKELQLEKEVLILKLQVLEREGTPEGLEAKKLDIERLKIEKEMLTLKNEGDERKRNHDKEMLELKNQQDSEKLQSTHNHEMAMKETDLKIDTLKMTERKIEAAEKRRHEEKLQQLKIEADEKRRHEEQQQQLSNDRYLLAATVIGTGAAAGAGAVLGSACALGAAVGAAAATAPISIPIALVSGICFAINRLRATSSS